VRGALGLGMLGDRARNVLCGRVHDVELRESDEAAAQISVQGDFDRGPQLVRGDDYELVEGPASVGTQEQPGEASSVLGEVLFARAATVQF
jgi:hypothetical protein